MKRPKFFFLLVVAAFGALLLQPLEGRCQSIPHGGIKLTTRNQAKFRRASASLICYIKSAPKRRFVPGKIQSKKIGRKKIRYFLSLKSILDSKLLSKRNLTSAARARLRSKFAAQFKRAKAECAQIFVGAGPEIVEHFLTLDRVDTSSLDQVSWDGITTMRPTFVQAGHTDAQAATVLQLNFEDSGNPGKDTSSRAADMSCASSCPSLNPSGRIGSAASFSGGQGLVTAIEHPRYGFADQDFTWAMWFRTSASDDLTLIGSYCGYGHKGLNLMIKGGKISFYVKPAGAESLTLSSATGGLNDGNWRHIAAVRNASTGQMFIYLDGVLDAAGQGPPLGGDFNCNKLAVGASSVTGTGWAGFKGDIDEVNLLERVLTADEIQHLAQGTKTTGSFRSKVFAFIDPVYSLAATVDETSAARTRLEISFDGLHWCPAGSTLFDPVCPYPARQMEYRVTFLDDTILDSIKFEPDKTPRCVDYDHDGYGSSADNGACPVPARDCNDANTNIFPGNPNPFCSCNADPGYGQRDHEICGDGFDNDCNGAADDEDYQCYQGGKIYYVSSSFGDDARDGRTPETAFKTVTMAQAVLDSFIQPGEKILFRRGDSWSEARLSLDVQGTADKWITVGSYGAGERPLFNVSSDQWIVNFQSRAAYIRLEGLHLTRSAKTWKAGGVSFSPGGSIDYITLNDMHIQGLAYGIVYSSQHFILENSIIEDNQNAESGGGHSQGFYTAGTPNGIVRNNEFHRNGKRVMFDHNIYLSEGSHGWLIENNVFTGSGGTSIVSHDNIDGVIIRGNTFHDNDTAVIDISDYSSDHIMHLDNFVVEGNRIFNNPWVFWLRGPKNLVVRNNLIYNNGPGNPLFAGGDAALRAIEGMKVENNTFYNNATTILALNTDGDISFKNNIVHQSAAVNRCIEVPNALSTFTNNLYYFPAQPNASYLSYGNSSYTLSGAQGIGLESGSLYGDPLFADPANLNLHLRSGSPAINAGAAVSVASDFDGTGRPRGGGYDIGAFEY